MARPRVSNTPMVDAAAPAAAPIPAPDSTVGRCAHCRSDARRGSDRRGIASLRSPAGILDHLRVNRQLLAVHQRHIGQFEREARGSFHAAGLDGISHATGDDLSAARHYESICDQRLRQSQRECIARQVAIARKNLIHAQR